MNSLIKIFLLAFFAVIMTTFNIHAANLTSKAKNNITLNEKLYQKIKNFNEEEKTYINQIKKLNLSLVKFKKTNKNDELKKRRDKSNFEHKRIKKYIKTIQKLKSIGIITPQDENIVKAIQEKEDASYKQNLFFELVLKKIKSNYSIQTLLKNEADTKK